MGPYLQNERLKFDPSKHEYTWDGIVKPSVTNILTSVGKRGKNGQWKGISDDLFCRDEIAANFGNAFHKIPSMFYRGQEANVPEPMIPWKETFLRWQKEHEWLVPAKDENGNLLIEYPMYHLLLDYCGTTDIIFETVKGCPSWLRDSIVVCDWKTSNHELEFWNYQTTGYLACYKDLFHGDKRKATMHVKFEADTWQQEIRNGDKITSDWNIFVSALNIYKKF